MSEWEDGFAVGVRVRQWALDAALRHLDSVGAHHDSVVEAARAFADFALGCTHEPTVPDEASEDEVEALYDRLEEVHELISDILEIE